MEDKQNFEKLIETESRSKSNTKRIDNLEKNIESIHNLALSIKEIATEMKAMREDVNKMDIRLNDLEEKPAKNWNNLTQQILTRYCNSNNGLFFCEI